KSRCSSSGHGLPRLFQKRIASADENTLICAARPEESSQRRAGNHGSTALRLPHQSFEVGMLQGMVLLDATNKHTEPCRDFVPNTRTILVADLTSRSQFCDPPSHRLIS